MLAKIRTQSLRFVLIFLFIIIYLLFFISGPAVHMAQDRDQWSARLHLMPPDPHRVID